MEEYVENLRGLADEYEKRPAWDKLGENDPSNQDNDFAKYGLGGEVKKTSSAYWRTTNSEYGRFQQWRKAMEENAQGSPVPTTDAIAKSLESLGVKPPSRDPGASARSRAESVAREEALHTEEMAEAISRQSTADKPLSERRAKYLTLRGTDISQSDSESMRRKLTTGFAKSYMRSSHPRLWDNVTTVAPGAGFLTSAAPGNHPDTQILTVGHPEENQDNLDEFLTKYGLSGDDSAPASRQSSAKPGSSRSRQQGYC